MNYEENKLNFTDSTDWNFDDALASAVTVIGVNTDNLNTDECWVD